MLTTARPAWSRSASRVLIQMGTRSVQVRRRIVMQQPVADHRIERAVVETGRHDVLAHEIDVTRFRGNPGHRQIVLAGRCQPLPPVPRRWRILPVGIPFRDAGSIEAVRRRQVSVSLRLRILGCSRSPPAGHLYRTLECRPEKNPSRRLILPHPPV